MENFETKEEIAAPSRLAIFFSQEALALLTKEEFDNLWELFGKVAKRRLGLETLKSS